MRGGWDDAVVVLAWLCCLPPPILASSLARDGVGRDIWYVSLANLTTMFRNLYIVSVCYGITSGFSKITILAFYLRIFPNVNFRRTTWVMIVLSAIWGIVFSCLWAFECSPISYAWTQWNSPTSGKCLRADLIAVVQAAFSLVLEVAIFILPIPILLRLRLNWRKKLQVCARPYTQQLVTL
jgi:hypothetical protein